MSDHACDQCEKVYKTRAGLWKHKKAKHSKMIGDDDVYLGRDDDSSQTTTHFDSMSDGAEIPIPPLDDTPSSETPSDSPSHGS